MHKNTLWRGSVAPIAVCLAALLMGAALTAHADEDRIRPWEENPYFWQYKGEPVLLLGGSWQDNLFNHPPYLEEHLDTLVSVGGNYLRNTMCSRNQGNVRAFAQNEDGLYDLDEWNDEYWERLDRFLQLTEERDIIVQIEIWDPWDYFEDHQSQGGWSHQAFNPANNVTYTAEESGLPTAYDAPPTGQPSDHPFFRSVPELDDLPLVLEYQKAFVDKILSITFDYDHVLYCMHNETGEELEFGDFWVRHVRARAEEAGKQIETADMRRSGNFATSDNQYLINNPDRYTFLEISQNNAQQGQTHWNRLQEGRALTEAHPRPINNTKIYTFSGGSAESVRRFWRNILGGAASSRFHRPHPVEDPELRYGFQEGQSGIGLSPMAQDHIRNMRTIMDEMGWPNIEPGLDFVELVMDTPRAVQTERTHVAYTRGADGQARLYIDGEEVESGQIGGDFSSWDPALRLALGDEFVGERGWLGAYHGVALYNRALDASEVADHHANGAPEHLDGLQARYAFDEGDGAVVHDVSGQEPALDLHIEDTGAVSWSDDGLELTDSVLIATQEPAERLTAAMQDTNAITLEAWITPAETVQEGPARIVTLSQDHGVRNFTLGHEEHAYEMRLRTTETNSNGLPGLDTFADEYVSVGAARTRDRDQAAIFVTHGALLDVDTDQFQDGLATQWFDPRTAERQDAEPNENGLFQPPSNDDWVLLLQ